MWGTNTCWMPPTSMPRVCRWGWPMLFQIGEKRGRAMFRVRKGLYTVVKYVRATPFGLAWQAAKGHPLQVGELLFYLLEPEGQGDPLGERPANEEG